MPRRLIALLIAATLGPAVGRAFAATAPETQIRILYTRNLPYIVSVGGFPGIVERWTQSLGERGRLISVDSGRARVSGGAYALNGPVPGAANLKETRSVRAIDQRRAILFVVEDKPSPVLDELAALGAMRTPDDTFPSGTILVNGTLETHSGPDEKPSRLLRLGPESDFWSPSHSIRYRIAVDGSEILVVIVAKPLGGLERLVPAIRRRVAASSSPAILVGLGGFGAWNPYARGDFETLLSPAAEFPFAVNALEGLDIAHGWGLLQRLGGERERPHNSPIFLCTNLKPLSPEAKLPCERSAVVEKAGVRFGFVSGLNTNDNPLLRSNDVPAFIEEPRAAIQEEIRSLWLRKNVDFVVLLNPSWSDAPLPWVGRVYGHNLLLGAPYRTDAVRHRSSIRFDDWWREPSKLAMHGKPMSSGFSEITLTTRKTGDRVDLLEAVESGIIVTPHDPVDPALTRVSETIIDSIQSGNADLLPDARDLWPEPGFPKFLFHPFEILSLSARLIREETGAEVSLVRLRSLGSDNLGPISEGMAAGWLRPFGSLFVVPMTGAQLRTVIPYLRRASIPVNPGEESLDDYTRADRFVSEGIDGSARIGGRQIAPDEIYRVATTRDALERLRTLVGDLPPTDLLEAGKPADAVVLERLRLVRERGAGGTTRRPARTMERTPPRPHGLASFAGADVAAIRERAGREQHRLLPSPRRAHPVHRPNPCAGLGTNPVRAAPRPLELDRRHRGRLRPRHHQARGNRPDQKRDDRPLDLGYRDPAGTAARAHGGDRTAFRRGPVLQALL